MSGSIECLRQRKMTEKCYFDYGGYCTFDRRYSDLATCDYMDIRKRCNVPDGVLITEEEYHDQEA